MRHDKAPSPVGSGRNASFEPTSFDENGVSAHPTCFVRGLDRSIGPVIDGADRFRDGPDGLGDDGRPGVGDVIVPPYPF